MASADLGPGLEDRKDRGTIRARLRRADPSGVRHDIHESFPYVLGVAANDRQSRTSAVSRARAWLSEQQRALRFDGVPVGTRLEDQTLGEWVKRYISEAEAGIEILSKKREARPLEKIAAHARKKGIQLEIYVLRGFVYEFPKTMAMAPDQLTLEHFKAIMDHLHHYRRGNDGEVRTLKPKTIGRQMSMLSAVYNAAVKEWGFKLANPLFGIKPPSAETADQRERKGKLVTAEELSRILAGIPEASPATRACIKFLRWSGGRRSEALRLEWSDIDFSQEIPTAHFRDTKSPTDEVRERIIPLDSRAVTALKELVEDRSFPETGKVFPISIDTPTRAWIRGRKRAGLLNVRLHDMRHTRTTEVTADLPVVDAQAITGHRDIRMLTRYYHPTAQGLGIKLLEAEALRAEKALSKIEKQTRGNAVGKKRKELSPAGKKAKALLRAAGMTIPDELK